MRRMTASTAAADHKEKQEPPAAVNRPCQHAAQPQANPAPGSISPKAQAAPRGNQAPEQPQDLFASFAAFDEPPDGEELLLAGTLA